MFIDFFKKEPVGIGGFLLIPIIAVISSTIFILLDIFYTLDAYSADIEMKYMKAKNYWDHP
jgi:hypothetical protein